METEKDIIDSVETIQQIAINTDKLCKLLGIKDLKVVQRELKKALTIKDSGVFKVGRAYRIIPSKYLFYLENKDKVQQWDDKENLKNSIKEVKHTTLTTMIKPQNKESVYQLARVLGM